MRRLKRSQGRAFGILQESHAMSKLLRKRAQLVALLSLPDVPRNRRPPTGWRTQTSPPVQSAWPEKNLVAECTTMSTPSQGEC